jgi:hypothetical protein
VAGEGGADEADNLIKLREDPSALAMLELLLLLLLEVETLMLLPV